MAGKNKDRKIQKHENSGSSISFLFDTSDFHDHNTSAYTSIVDNHERGDANGFNVDQTSEIKYKKKKKHEHKKKKKNELAIISSLDDKDSYDHYSLLYNSLAIDAKTNNFCNSNINLLSKTKLKKRKKHKGKNSAIVSSYVKDLCNSYEVEAPIFSAKQCVDFNDKRSTVKKFCYDLNQTDINVEGKKKYKRKIMKHNENYSCGHGSEVYSSKASYTESDGLNDESIKLGDSSVKSKHRKSQENDNDSDSSIIYLFDSKSSHDRDILDYNFATGINKKKDTTDLNEGLAVNIKQKNKGKHQKNHESANVICSFDTNNSYNQCGLTPHFFPSNKYTGYNEKNNFSDSSYDDSVVTKINLEGKIRQQEKNKHNGENDLAIISSFDCKDSDDYDSFACSVANDSVTNNCHDVNLTSKNNFKNRKKHKESSLTHPSSYDAKDSPRKGQNTSSIEILTCPPDELTSSNDINNLTNLYSSDVKDCINHKSTSLCKKGKKHKDKNDSTIVSAFGLKDSDDHDVLVYNSVNSDDKTNNFCDSDLNKSKLKNRKKLKNRSAILSSCDAKDSCCSFVVETPILPLNQCLDFSKIKSTAKSFYSDLNRLNINLTEKSKCKKTKNCKENNAYKHGSEVYHSEESDTESNNLNDANTNLTCKKKHRKDQECNSDSSITFLFNTKNSHDHDIESYNSVASDNKKGDINELNIELTGKIKHKKKKKLNESTVVCSFDSNDHHNLLGLTKHLFPTNEYTKDYEKKNLNKNSCYDLVGIKKSLTDTDKNKHRKKKKHKGKKALSVISSFDDKNSKDRNSLACSVANDNETNNFNDINLKNKNNLKKRKKHKNYSTNLSFRDAKESHNSFGVATLIFPPNESTAGDVTSNSTNNHCRDVNKSTNLTRVRKHKTSKKYEENKNSYEHGSDVYYDVKDSYDCEGYNSVAGNNGISDMYNLNEDLTGRITHKVTSPHEHGSVACNSMAANTESSNLTYVNANQREKNKHRKRQKNEEDSDSGINLLYDTKDSSDRDSLACNSVACDNGMSDTYNLIDDLAGQIAHKKVKSPYELGSVACNSIAANTESNNLNYVNANQKDKNKHKKSQENEEDSDSSINLLYDTKDSSECDTLACNSGACDNRRSDTNYLNRHLTDNMKHKKKKRKKQKGNSDSTVISSINRNDSHNLSVLTTQYPDNEIILVSEENNLSNNYCDSVGKKINLACKNRLEKKKLKKKNDSTIISLIEDKDSHNHDSLVNKSTASDDEANNFYDSNVNFKSKNQRKKRKKHKENFSTNFSFHDVKDSQNSLGVERPIFPSNEFTGNDVTKNSINNHCRDVNDSLNLTDMSKHKKHKENENCEHGSEVYSSEADDGEIYILSDSNMEKTGKNQHEKGKEFKKNGDLTIYSSFDVQDPENHSLVYKSTKNLHNKQMDSKIESLFDRSQGDNFSFFLNCDESPVDFKVPPLHEFETVYPFSQKQLDELETAGVSFTRGKFTAAEDEIIKRNFDEFMKHYGVSDPIELFGIGRYSKNLPLLRFFKAKHFYVRLAKDLNDRTLHSVYYRARNILHPLKNSGGFTAKEIESLKKLQACFPNQWSLIAKTLGKTAIRCKNAYSWNKKNFAKGKFTEVEEAQLIKAIKKVSCNSDLSCESLKHISWKAVASFVPSRHPSQCHSYWAFNLAWKSNSVRKKWNHYCYCKLVHILKTNWNVKNVSEIDWYQVYKSFEDFAPSSYYVQRRWFSLRAGVPDYKYKSYKDIIEILSEKFPLSQSNENCIHM